MAMTEDGVVRVTLKDVYEVVVDLRDKVSAVPQLQASSADHEQRLRKVERWVYALPPTLLLSAISVVVALKH